MARAMARALWRARAQISKMLQQVATGKQFSDDAVHLSPLNEYITTAQAQFLGFFRAGALRRVPSASRAGAC